MVWPGVCREENSTGDDSSRKKLSLLFTPVGIVCLCSSSDFPSQFSQIKKKIKNLYESKTSACLPLVCPRLQQPCTSVICHSGAVCPSWLYCWCQSWAGLCLGSERLESSCVEKEGWFKLLWELIFFFFFFNVQWSMVFFAF